MCAMRERERELLVNMRTDCVTLICINLSCKDWQDPDDRSHGGDHKAADNHLSQALHYIAVGRLMCGQSCGTIPWATCCFRAF